MSNHEQKNDLETETQELEKLKNAFFDGEQNATENLVAKVKQYIDEGRDKELSAFLALKETDKINKIMALSTDSNVANEFKLEDLHTATLKIDENNPHHVIATWVKHNEQDVTTQKFFIDKFNGMDLFYSNRNALIKTPKSLYTAEEKKEAEVFTKLKSMLGESIFCVLNKLHKNKVEEIIDHYVSKHKLQYASLMIHNLLAYGGEGFYIYWDVNARLDTTSGVVPPADNSIVGSSRITWNKLGNYPATAPIAVANFTFDPKAEIRGYFQSLIEDPNNALSEILKEHPVLATMFVLYAFGGGYSSVVDLQDSLQDAVGTAGKYFFSSLLVYSALVYYTVYNFKDTIELYGKWMGSDSLLLNALKEARQGNFEEASTNIVVAIHEFLALTERVFRMSYGGYEAGKQQLNKLAGVIMGSAVGAGTIPVALATRCMATRSFYDLSGIPKHIVAEAGEKFHNQFSSSFLRKIWREINLLIDPAIFLQAAVTWLAYDQANGEAGNNQGMAAATASLTACMLHLIYRGAAKRKMIVKSAKEMFAEEQKTHEISYSPKTETNTAGKYTALVATSFDQSSRIVTFGYSVAAMLPAIFGTFALSKEERNGEEATVNYKNLAILLLIETYITASAFRYQLGKTQQALTSFLARFFAKKPVAQGSGAQLESIALLSDSNALDVPPEVAMAVELRQDVNAGHRRNGMFAPPFPDSSNGYPNSDAEEEDATSYSALAQERSSDADKPKSSTKKTICKVM